MEVSGDVEFTAIARKWGNSLYVAIPADIVKALKLKPGSALRLRIVSVMP